MLFLYAKSMIDDEESMFFFNSPICFLFSTTLRSQMIKESKIQPVVKAEGVFLMAENESEKK